MTPARSHRVFEGLPDKTQAPGLDAVLDRLHTQFGFPIANSARPAAGGERLSRAYVQKLEFLLKLDHARVNKAIASLEITARELGSRRQGNRSVRKLITEFDKILESELSQLQDDRDLSILELTGLGPGFRDETENGVEMAGRKEPVDEFGRFDDPLTEHSSPTASAGRTILQSYLEAETPMSCISEVASKGTYTLLPLGNGIPETRGGASAEVSIPSPPALDKRRERQNPRYFDGVPIPVEMSTDDSSDQSFYSCPTPPRLEHAIEENIEVAYVHSRPGSTDSDETLRVIHRTQRAAYPTPDPEPVQKVSYLRSSNKGKGPCLSTPYPKPEARTQRKLHLSQFPLAKQRGNLEEQMLEIFGTGTTYSAESSFSASSSFSNKPGKDWSPPTSLETSFNENVGSMIRPARRERPWLSIVAERPDEPELPGDTEVSYHGDCDYDTTDIDDSDTSNESCVLAQVPKKALSQPSRKRDIPGNRQKKASAIPKPNRRKVEPDQARQQTTDDEDEATSHRLAEENFGEGLELNWGPPLVPSVISVSKTHPADGQAAYTGEDSEACTGDGPLLGETGDENSAGEWSDTNSRSELAEERWDDENEFGAIDTSFGEAFSDITALKSTSHPLPTLHFSIQHEVTRVALNEGPCSNDAICDHIRGYCDDLYEAQEYRDVWNALTQFSKAATTLEQTNESVWRSFKERRGWPDNVYLTGSVHYGELQQVHGSPIKGRQPSSQGRSSEKLPLTITLNPLTRTRGNRFFNRFGSDRFLHLGLPSLSRQPGLSDADLQQRLACIIDWLADEEIVLMNRTWKCFYIKEKKSKKKSDPGKTLLAVFFATKGVGIGDSLSDQEMDALGFRKFSGKLRQEMSVGDLLKWHIPLDGNVDMTVPKFWSRISLGFSTSTPTITFLRSQIEFVDDIKSRIGEVMNDGCSVVSPAVMKFVRQTLGLEETPTAVQARLGGAKGVWMVDPDVDWDSEEIYIRVTESQLKYKGYDNDDDWARLTLDVLTTSHDPTPATINTQLIPILEDRGVSFETLRELLEEHLEGDLEELFSIIDVPVELRRWMHHQGNVGKERMTTKTVTTLGGIPVAKHEIAIMLLESGFLVRECNFLVTQVRKTIDQYCNDLKTKLRIKIPSSTTLLCVADPTGTLREGEVSLRFSNGVLDSKTKRRSSVVIGDILVARNPAHLPSDIQKVKAVDLQNYHSPGLRELQDVVVFSVRGDRSLASLLSGGDYDGDKPWVCWDQRLVESFQNSASTFVGYEKRALGFFEKSPTTVADLLPHQPGFFNRFFRAGISNSLQDDFLGVCTSVWEKYCYDQNGISDPKAIELAKLCSILVDAPKQGLTILPSKREEIMRLGNRYMKPAYKEPGSRSKGVHIIDRLHFDVAEQRVTEKQTAFHSDFGESPSYEPLFTETFRRERGCAEKEGSRGLLALTLKHLIAELESISQAWRNWTTSDDGGYLFRPLVLRLHRQFREIMPPEESCKDPVISRWVSDGESHFSHWSILRASAAYYQWRGKSALVWQMASPELCFIKAHAAGLKSGFVPRTIIGDLYITLKARKLWEAGRPIAGEAEEEEEVEGAGEDSS